MKKRTVRCISAIIALLFTQKSFATLPDSIHQALEANVEQKIEKMIMQINEQKLDDLLAKQMQQAYQDQETARLNKEVKDSWPQSHIKRVVAD